MDVFFEAILLPCSFLKVGCLKLEIFPSDSGQEVIFVKKKSRKKRIIIVLVAAMVFLAGIMMLFPKGELPVLTAQSSFLQKDTIQSTVVAEGNIESTDCVNVYAGLNYPIEEVAAQVGDHVKAGDLLYTLDSEELEEAIEKGEVDLRTAQASAQQQIQTSQKQYNDQKSLLENGLNTQINSAQDAVEQALSGMQSAERALQQAQEDQDTAEKALDSNLNADLVNAKSAANTAKTAYDRAEAAYKERYNQESDAYKRLKDDVSDQEKLVRACEDAVTKARQAQLKDPGSAELAAKVAAAEADLSAAESELLRLEQEMKDYESLDEGYDMDDPTRQSLRQLREARDDAKDAYASAVKNLQIAQAAVDQQMETYSRSVAEAQSAYDQAKQAYESALTSQKAVQASVEQSLSDAQQAVTASRLAADNSSAQLALNNQKEDLEKCSVTSPVDGIVTAVYAEEGEAANGLMYVIEDTESLKIKVKIKEYDVNTIKPGMKAIVTAEAAGEQEYEGVVESISPAAVRAQNAENASQEVLFEAVVVITSADENLRIGMSARAEIITEEKTDVFSVPYEMLSTDEQGRDILYTVEETENGLYLPVAVPVELGIESDSRVEVSGEGLTEGMTLLSDARQVVPGMPILLATGEEAAGTELLADGGSTI